MPLCFQRPSTCTDSRSAVQQAQRDKAGLAAALSDNYSGSARELQTPMKLRTTLQVCKLGPGLGATRLAADVVWCAGDWRRMSPRMQGDAFAAVSREALL
jgi:hypothetical protein